VDDARTIARTRRLSSTFSGQGDVRHGYRTRLGDLLARLSTRSSTRPATASWATARPCRSRTLSLTLSANMADIWETVHKFMLAIVGVAAAACASTLSEKASRIRWAEAPQDVTGCESLGMVEGTSTQTGAANISTGRNNARNEALERAASRGATHVRWLENQEAFMGLHITAEAFSCRSRDDSRASDEISELPTERSHAQLNPIAEDPADGAQPNRVDASDAKAGDKPAGNYEGEAKKESRAISTGTCFFVSESGLALSSLHVVRASKSIFVIDVAGRRLGATVLASNEKLDLVALQVDEEKIPAALPISDKEAALGDHVFTIGFPAVVDLGFDPKLTEGSISGERGLGLDFLLQTSTPVQPGNSGGPLINDAGHVVGIVALRQNYFSDGSSATNTAFAVKATAIRKAFRSLSFSSGKAAKDRKAAIARAREAACLVVATDQDPLTGH
jgi:S1-C subfamily serine protease